MGKAITNPRRKSKNPPKEGTVVKRDRELKRKEELFRAVVKKKTCQC